MSGLTPETARAAADAYASQFGVASNRDREIADWFRREADRLEVAAKTPGQVAYEAWCDLRAIIACWDRFTDSHHREWEPVAAAVIDHHVGASNIMLSRDDGEKIQRILIGMRGTEHLCARLREALS